MGVVGFGELHYGQIAKNEKIIDDNFQDWIEINQCKCTSFANPPLN